MIITNETAAKLKASLNLTLGVGVNLRGHGRFGLPSMCYNGAGFGLDLSWGSYSYMVPPFEVKRLVIGNYTSIANHFIVAEDHPVDLLTASPVAFLPWIHGSEFLGRHRLHLYPALMQRGWRHL